MHSISTKKAATIFGLFFFANLIFFILSYRLLQFENGVYLKYFQSMIADQDFNIFNQFSNSIDQWMATANYNHPDFHSPFISTLLIFPYFFSFGSLDGGMVGSSLFFTLALFAYCILNGYKEEHPRLTSYREWFYFLIFSMGSLWFTFFDPSEMSAICLIFTIIIFFELYNFWKEKSENVMTLSLALGYFSILKPDGLFYAITICCFFVYQKKWRKIFPVIGILVLCQSQILIVNYVRYGEFLAPNPVISFHHTYIVDYLIGPNGLFVKTPVILFLFAIMIYRIFTTQLTRERYLLMLALIVTILKATVLGFAITPVTDYVANRHSIAEIPFFAYGLFSMFKDKRKLGRIILSLFVIWNIYDLYGCFLNYHNSGHNYLLIFYVPFEKASEYFIFAIHRLQEGFLNFMENEKNIIFLSVNSSIFLTLSYFLHLKYKKHFRNIFLGTLIFITCSFTLTDVLNNKKNTAVLRNQNIYRDTVIAHGKAVYYDEMMSMIEHLWIVSEAYHKPSRRLIAETRQAYIQEILNDIIYDPTSFTSDLKKGKIRPSYWKLKSP